VAGVPAIKSQSAMEYLMTYGWSILIIAVVLGILFQLGLFSGQSFAPKAQPGSCKVVKLGSLGAQTTSLVGVCNNELPQFAGYFPVSASKIVVASTPMLNPTNAVTVSFWMDLTAPTGSNQWPVLVSKALNSQYSTYMNPGGTNVEWSVVTSGGQQWVSFIAAAPLNQWLYYTATYNSTIGALYTYLNGVKISSSGLSGQISAPSGSGNLYISSGGSSATYYIADVQIYNTSLDASQIQALYQEGIGGAPINLQNLVGWWPLNGDANDYSGNNNNGAPTNVGFTTQWLSGYSQPH
jgi:hypothetical protein